jgi:anti-sigma B factor antagonist
MDARIEHDGDTASVRVRGGLDISTEHELHQAIGALDRAGSQRIRVDLSGVDFIDSRGLSALLTIHKEWSQRGRTVAFLGPLQPAVQRVLDVTRVDDELAFVEPSRLGDGSARSST